MRRALLIPLLVAVVVGASGIGTSLVLLMDRLVCEQVGARGRHLASVISSIAEDPVDEREVQQIVSALGSQQDVQLIVLVGGTPVRVLGSTRKDWNGRLLTDLPAKEIGEDLLGALAGGQGSVQVHPSGLIDVTLPVQRRQDVTTSVAGGGAVMVHLDPGPARQEMLGWTLGMAGVLLVACGLVGVFAYTLLSRRVLEPLRAIGAQVQSRRVGDSLRLPAVPDEIQRLAEVVNEALSRSEVALHDLEIQKKALDAHTIVSVTDLSGTITYINDRFCEVSGYSREELLGSNHRLVNSGHHPTEFFKDMWRTIAAGGVWHGQICNRAKDGTLYWVDSTMVPLLGLDGRPQSYISIRTDITAQVAQQEELRSMNVRLTEQTALAEEMTNQAQAASIAKSDFLANMSHELRTPMNGVIGMNSLLLETSLDTEQRQMLETAQASANAMMNVVNDLLDFVKIEEGRIELEDIPFSLQEMLDDVVAALGVKADEKGLVMTCEIAGDVPERMRGDPNRLRQVVTNLVSNAIKFTTRGEVALEASLQRSDDGNGLLRLSVRDTGIGIAPEQRDRLFHAFSQVDSSTTRRHGGTGLGLAICKQLATLMGGAIGIESAPGVGSTVWCTARVRTSGIPEFQSGTYPSLCGRRVLVVEPHERSRRILARHLWNWGAEVIQTDCVESALSLIGRAREAGRLHDLVMLSIAMDGIGAGFLRTLAADPLLCAIPTVALASTSRREEIRREIGEICTFILGRPGRTVDLAATCARAIARARTGRRGPATDQYPRGTAISLPRGARVLLVEDNLLNQAVGRSILRRLGAETVTAASGAEALLLMQQQRFSVILMDLQLPDIDGVELMQRIRDPQTLSLDPGIPVIALTADVLDEDRERCLAAGMAGYVTKPIDPLHLGGLLAKVLGRVAARPETDANRV